MLKVLAAALLLIGSWLAFRGFSTWNQCGYDCQISSQWPILSATGAMILGLILLLFGVAALATLLPGVRTQGPRS